MRYTKQERRASVKSGSGKSEKTKHATLKTMTTTRAIIAAANGNPRTTRRNDGKK